MKSAVLCVAIVVVLAAMTFAEVPHLISYQGQLTDATSGNPLSGTYDVTFNLYTVAEGAGMPLWTEMHKGVVVDNGVFGVLLGSVEPFDGKADFSEQYWLGVAIDDGAEMAPRFQLSASPYSLNIASLGAEDGQVLMWNADKKIWEPTTLDGGLMTLDAGDADSDWVNVYGGDIQETDSIYRTGRVLVGRNSAMTTPQGQLYVWRGTGAYEPAIRGEYVANVWGALGYYNGSVYYGMQARSYPNSGSAIGLESQVQNANNVAGGMYSAYDGYAWSTGANGFLFGLRARADGTSGSTSCGISARVENGSSRDFPTGATRIALYANADSIAGAYAGWFERGALKIPDFNDTTGVGKAEGSMFWEGDANRLWIYDGAKWKNMGGLDTSAGGGTANYIAKWSSASKLTSSGIYENAGGNVGIGIAQGNEPLAKLHVNGGVNDGLNEALRLGGGSTNEESGPAINFNQRFGDDSYPDWIIGQIGAVATNMAGYDGALVFNTNNGGGDIDLTEKMRITADGKVGIGTATPEYKLDVAGDIGIRGYLDLSAGTLIKDSYGNLAPESGHILVSDGNGDGSVIWDDLHGPHCVHWVSREEWCEDTKVIYTGCGLSERDCSEGFLGVSKGGFREDGITPINHLYGPNRNTHVNLGGYSTTGGSPSGDWDYCTISGGKNNAATHSYSTVCGGLGNTADSLYTVVCGGTNNNARDEASAVCGGKGNTAGVPFPGHGQGRAFVGGGEGNTSMGDVSCICGGSSNTAFGVHSAILGGSGNNANGDYSAIPGGSGNTAGGNYSFAAGRRAKANHAGCFVWADQTDADYISTAADQFRVRAGGGVFMETIPDDVVPTDVLTLDAATNQVMKYDISLIGGDNWGTQVIFSELPLHGDGTLSSPLEIFKADAGSDGYLSSTDWSLFYNHVTTDDADLDITNELQTLQEVYNQGLGTPSGNYVDMSVGGSGEDIRFYTTTDEILFLKKISGNVGIGKTNPAEKLEIIGKVRIGNGTDYYILPNSVGSVNQILKYNDVSHEMDWANDNVDDADHDATNEKINYVEWEPIGEPVHTYRITEAGINYDEIIPVDEDNLLDNDIHELRDVSDAVPATGQILKWNGTEWAIADDWGGGDDDWLTVTTPAKYIRAKGSDLATEWGIAGRSAILRGTKANTHINFGFASSSGSTSEDVEYCTISGGLNNEASGYISTIGGGENNQAFGRYSTVSGGNTNHAIRQDATVGGGDYNDATGHGSTVAGGHECDAEGDYSAVGGGRNNWAAGSFSVICGGGGEGIAADRNIASGTRSAILCGRSNTAAGDYSFAFGNDVDIMSDGDNTVAFYSAENPGYVAINKASPMVAPDAALEVNGTVKITQVLHLEPTDPPTSPARGDIYYDGTLDVVRIWDGFNWHNLW